MFATLAKRLLEGVPRGSRRFMTYTVHPRTLFYLLRVVLFAPQEGANQVVPEALMDMAMKVCKPFHNLWMFLLQEF